MMVMILKVKSRIIKMKSSIMKGVMMINSRMDFFSDLSNMLRWSWFWKWNRAWWKRGDDDQIQDGLLLRPLKCVTNGFHQRGLPCGLQVLFLLWLFYRSSDNLPSLSSETTMPKMQCKQKSNQQHHHHQQEQQQYHPIPDKCKFWYTTA